MRSTAARCLYRFSRAPISAEITVTSEDGQEQIATTSVGEKDGWLSLRAENFTFSTPSISAVLTQKDSDQSEADTLTCVKKKKVKGPKKVIVVSEGQDPPQCPRGYRPKPQRKS